MPSLTKMTPQEKLNRLRSIEAYHGSSSSGVAKIMEEPELVDIVRLDLKLHNLCPPYPPQWDYWHYIAETGGILPVYAGSIREAYESICLA